MTYEPVAYISGCALCPFFRPDDSPVPGWKIFLAEVKRRNGDRPTCLNLAVVKRCAGNLNGLAVAFEPSDICSASPDIGRLSLPLAQGTDIPLAGRFVLKSPVATQKLRMMSSFCVKVRLFVGKGKATYSLFLRTIVFCVFMLTMFPSDVTVT